MSLTRDRFRLPARRPVLGTAAAALTTAALLAPLPAQAAPVTGSPVPVQTATVASRGGLVGSATLSSTTSSLTAAQRAAARAAVVRAGVLRTAASLKGRPYRYGASGPSSFDCSGYTRYVFARNGISLPRTSSAQYRAARRISKAGAKPGDLVFFGTGSRVYHVAIYAGNGRIWHSPRPGKTVRLVKIWTSRWSAGRIV
jgi:cell wall-associated NlpC family hydrolase